MRSLQRTVQPMISCLHGLNILLRTMGRVSPSANIPYTSAVIISAASVHVQTTTERPSFRASVWMSSPLDVSATLNPSPRGTIPHTCRYHTTHINQITVYIESQSRYCHKMSMHYPSQQGDSSTKVKCACTTRNTTECSCTPMKCQNVPFPVLKNAEISRGREFLDLHSIKSSRQMGLASVIRSPACSWFDETSPVIFTSRFQRRMKLLVRLVAIRSKPTGQ